MKPMYSRIAGTGRYLPERILTNQDLEQMVDTTSEWILSRTGIERRHIAADDQTTADLAELAARQALDAAGAGDVTVVDVPGAFELPLVASRFAETGYDAVVAIGAVVKGETDHYEHIARCASDGLMAVTVRTGVPVTLGVLTVSDPSHAFARSAPDQHNKGREAAEAAVRAANVLRQLS